MIGTTLEEIRDHIERLAAADGEYYLVCARYGDRPVPAAGLRFGDRPTARAAARATEQYRAALRRYDPGVPRYDVIVCQLCGRHGRPSGRDPSEPRADGSDWGNGIDEPDGIGRAVRPDDDERWTLSEPVVNGRTRRYERRRRLVERCHRIAAAVFEALSENGCRDVETAVMNRYFELAESLPDPDDLCLRLLEAMATELADRLPPEDLIEVLSRAASRLEGPRDAFDASERTLTARDGADDAPDTFSATLADLRERGLLDGFTRLPSASGRLTDPERGTEAVVETARITGYALSPRDGALPVLPIVVELLGRSPERRPTGIRVEPADAGWTIRIFFDRDGDPDGLTISPIRSPGS